MWGRSGAKIWEFRQFGPILGSRPVPIPTNLAQISQLPSRQMGLRGNRHLLGLSGVLLGCRERMCVNINEKATRREKSNSDSGRLYKSKVSYFGVIKFLTGLIKICPKTALRVLQICSNASSAPCSASRAYEPSSDTPSVRAPAPLPRTSETCLRIPVARSSPLPHHSTLPRPARSSAPSVTQDTSSLKPYSAPGSLLAQPSFGCEVSEAPPVNFQRQKGIIRRTSSTGTDSFDFDFDGTETKEKDG
ncbi:hypothetical protein B0H11DRAFT_2208563 [Mycena galericulata]|nr:hypothetical protein B0H11DRAFT_2208563 [Mycena galericulata]